MPPKVKAPPKEPASRGQAKEAAPEGVKPKGKPPLPDYNPLEEYAVSLACIAVSRAKADQTHELLNFKVAELYATRPSCRTAALPGPTCGRRRTSTGPRSMRSLSRGPQSSPRNSVPPTQRCGTAIYLTRLPGGRSSSLLGAGGLIPPWVTQAVRHRRRLEHTHATRPHTRHVCTYSLPRVRLTLVRRPAVAAIGRRLHLYH